MEIYASERRISPRLPFKIPMRVRAWKSGPGEQLSESENLSDRGAFFDTDAPLIIGSAVEILLRMPEEVTGKPAIDWRCTGHVVRLEPIDASRARLGVGVQFDCYEILCSRANIPL